MQYVDGFVLPVSNKNLAAYRRLAQKAGKIWMEYGALAYVECVGDDVKPGKLTSFPQSVKLKPDETVIFRGSSTSRARTATGSTSRSWPIPASPAWIRRRCRSTASA